MDSKHSYSFLHAFQTNSKLRPEDLKLKYCAELMDES